MKKSSLASILLLTLIYTLSLNNVVSDGPRDVENWFETLSHKRHPEKMTKLHFYFHDFNGNKNATEVVVARSNVSLPFFFGMLLIADDPMTVGPELISKWVGYLKGLYGTASFKEVDLFMATTFVFTDEIYNGSSLSIFGHNPHQHLYREIPIVGGSGRFCLARGIATLKTYYYDSIAGKAIIEVDIVAFHY